MIFYIHVLSWMIHRFDNDPIDLEVDRDRSFRSQIKDERCQVPRVNRILSFYFLRFFSDAKLDLENGGGENE